MFVTEIPKVEILQAIKPTNSGTGDEALVYHNLARAVDNYKVTNRLRTNAVWDAETDSVEELFSAKQLALEYLLRTALGGVNSHPENHDMWADRFTQASSELYGTPEPTEVAHLINHEFSIVSDLVGDSRVSQEHVQLLLDEYRPLVDAGSKIAGAGTENLDITHEKLAIRRYGDAIFEKYQPIFNLVEADNKHQYNPQDLLKLFGDALDWLKYNDDPSWNDWKAIIIESTHMSVVPEDRLIKIGSRRPSASRITAKSLIAHELLVHALRSKNGYKTGDEKLATGLPGNLASEEGLGVLSGEAVTGVLPEAIYDRYLDIALALGTVDGVQRTRQEMFQMSYARQLIKAQLRGDTEEELASLAPRVWGQIDRIYRGGRGDNQGAKQAIFTKDIVYYEGYKQMAEYITNQLDGGKSAVELFDYLSQAKFDPTNPKHVAHLHKAKG